MLPAPPPGVAAPGGAARIRLSVSARAALYATGALLWLSGCGWLVLHYGFAQATQFGPLPNPWEPLVLRLHGSIAVAAVFLCGWITAAHALDRLPHEHNRLSGLVLSGGAVLLVLTGYALYYTTDALHEGAAAAHEWLGAAAIAAALAHWVRRRPRA